MAKISLVYWSGTGNTQAMADYVVEGVKSAGAEVDVFEVTEANADDVWKKKAWSLLWKKSKADFPVKK